MIKEKSKDSYSRSSLIWSRIDDSLDYALLGGTVLGCFLSLFFFFFFLFPSLSRALFLLIVAGVSSRPSTQTAMDPCLDTCSIGTLLVVVECVTSCKNTIQGHFAIKCGRLCWYSAFYAKMTDVLLRSFLILLPAHFYSLPQPPIMLVMGWPLAQGEARSSDSLD